MERVVNTRPTKWLARSLAFLSVVFALEARAVDVQLLSAPDAAYSASATAGGDSAIPVLSADGRYVLFGATANNLVATGSNSNQPLASQGLYGMNVFRRDRITGATDLVSVNLAGTGGGDDNSAPLAISTNGQFALFESSAGNLVPDDTNNVSDVFVRDLVNGTTILVSVATNGVSARGPSTDAMMTPDGRYVAFSSTAPFLVPGQYDTNFIVDTFVRDLQSNNTVLVSVGAKPVVALFPPFSLPYGTSASDVPQITPDGHYVAFLSTATNLVPNGIRQGEVYLRDLWAGNTTMVSAAAHSYFTVSNVCYNPKISDDGEFVVYETSLLSGATNGIIFRNNTQTHANDLVTSNAVPAGNDWRSAETLDVTPDGRFVAYVGIVDPGPPLTSGVFLWDGVTATTTLLSLDRDGNVPTNSTCDLPVMAASGSFVSFQSTATNLTTNVVGSGPHFYLRDVQAGTTKLLDVGTNGAALTRNFFGALSLTPDARFVAFDCAEPDLVAGDDNHAADVFVRDLQTDALELISTHHAALPSQTPVPGSVSRLSISADGRLAAFAGAGRGVLDSYTNRYTGIFVRDLLTGTNRLVSVDTNGLGGANGASVDPVISADGRYVAFTSAASNLLAGDTNKVMDVFLADLQTGTTELVSSYSHDFNFGDWPSYAPTVNADGRYVLFFSQSLNVGGIRVTRGIENVYVRDRTVPTNRWLTADGGHLAATTPDGRYTAFIGAIDTGLSPTLYVWDAQTAQRIYTNSSFTARNLAISPNGQWIAINIGTSILLRNRTSNSNVVAGSSPAARPGMRFSDDSRYFTFSARTTVFGPADSNNAPDVYVYDFQTGTNRLISHAFNSSQDGNDRSDSPAISGDGRYVVYRSSASDIVAGDSNGMEDIFLNDTHTGVTTLLSASVAGAHTADWRSTAPRFTGDGQTIVFQSQASDLVTNDFNQAPDGFVVRIYSSNSAPVFAGEIVYVAGSGQPPAIRWFATPGVTYQVQFKDDLADPVWHALNGSVTIAGDRGTAVDFAPNPVARFYRIVAF